MDFEKLFSEHFTHFKKIIKYKYNKKSSKEEEKHQDGFTDTLCRAIAMLFDSSAMGKKFRPLWDEYNRLILQYIECVFDRTEESIDFGEEHLSRDIPPLLRKLRKSNGKIIGFFSYYLKKKKTFRENWIGYIQWLKNSIDDGVRVMTERGTNEQFLKSVSVARGYIKNFGRCLNKFI